MKLKKPDLEVMRPFHWSTRCSCSNSSPNPTANLAAAAPQSCAASRRSTSPLGDPQGRVGEPDRWCGAAGRICQRLWGSASSESGIDFRRSRSQPRSPTRCQIPVSPSAMKPAPPRCSRLSLGAVDLRRRRRRLPCR